MCYAGLDAGRKQIRAQHADAIQDVDESDHDGGQHGIQVCALHMNILAYVSASARSVLCMELASMQPFYRANQAIQINKVERFVVCCSALFDVELIL